MKTDYFFDLTKFEHRHLFNQCNEVWKALNNIESYFKSFSFGERKIKVPAGVFLENPEMIFIGQDSIIEPGAFIRGPAIIGKRCQIRHGAYLRGGVITGDDCVIGHGSEVKNSIF